jgi:hypothetical protein
MQNITSEDCFPLYRQRIAKKVRTVEWWEGNDRNYICYYRMNKILAVLNVHRNDRSFFWQRYLADENIPKTSLNSI